MNRLHKHLIASAALAACTLGAQASSDREALAVLSERGVDNTDTCGWVSNSSRDGPCLIISFKPLREPGQGDHGSRADRLADGVGPFVGPIVGYNSGCNSGDVTSRESGSSNRRAVRTEAGHSAMRPPGTMIVPTRYTTPQVVFIC